MSRPSCLGIDLGGTHVRAARWQDGKCLDSFVSKTREVFVTEDPCYDLAAYILQCYPERKYDAIAVGVPSALDVTRRYVIDTPSIPQLCGIAFADALQKRMQVPVFLDRDVNLLLLADMERLQLPENGTIAGVYIGTGIGNALWVNGGMYYGKNGCAGELGHIPTGNRKRKCSCGNYGCAETVAAGRYLSELAADKAPATPIASIFLRHWDEEWLRAFVTEAAIAIAAEITILDPDCLILGGGVIEMEAFPLETLKKEIRRWTRNPYPAEQLEIIVSEGGRLSGTRGAALMAERCLKRKEPVDDCNCK